MNQSKMTRPSRSFAATCRGRRWLRAAALALIAVPLLGAAPVQDAWTPKFTFRPAAQARDAFLAQVKTADAARTAGQKTAREKYAAALKKSLEAAMTQGDLDEANRVTAELEAVAAGATGFKSAKTAPKRFVGKYEIRSGKPAEKNLVFAIATFNADFTCTMSIRNQTGLWYVEGNTLHVYWAANCHDFLRVPPSTGRLLEGKNIHSDPVRYVPVN